MDVKTLNRANRLSDDIIHYEEGLKTIEDALKNDYGPELEGVLRMTKVRECITRLSGDAKTELLVSIMNAVNDALEAAKKEFEEL